MCHCRIGKNKSNTARPKNPQHAAFAAVCTIHIILPTNHTHILGTSPTVDGNNIRDLRASQPFPSLLHSTTPKDVN